MKPKIFPFAITLSLALLFATQGYAASVSALTAKSNSAADVIEEVVRISDRSIPISLLDRAVCIATIPDVIRAGFIFGARVGRGLVACRVPGGWSEPSFIKVAGGSWGLQIGLAAVDMVLVFVNHNAVDRLSVNNFTLGGDISVAIGPIGRDAQVGTDYQLSSEAYSYSRSRGLFAGLTIEGASMMVDKKSNAKFYEVAPGARDLLTADGREAPAALMSYVDSLNRNAP